MDKTIRGTVTGPDGESTIVDVPTSIVNSKGEITDNDAYEKLASDALAKKAATKAGGPDLKNPALPGIFKSMNENPAVLHRSPKTLGLDIDPVNSILRAVEAFSGDRPVAGTNNLIDAAGDFALPLGGEALVNAPIKALGTAAAGYAGSKVGEKAGEFAGGDADTMGLLSRLGAIIGGSAVASPKLRGAAVGGAQAARANAVPAMAAGIGMKYLGAPKWLDAATAAAIEAPDVARGIMSGASGKPWIDPAFSGVDKPSRPNWGGSHDAEFVDPKGPTMSTGSSNPQSNVVKASISGSNNVKQVSAGAPKQIEGNVRQTNEVAAGKDVKGDIVNLDKIKKFFEDKGIKPWELTPEEYKKAGYHDLKATAGNTELNGAKTHELLVEDAKSKGLPTYDSLKPSLEGNQNKIIDVKPDLESKIIIPKSHVEQHASDNGINYDEALSHYPSEEFEVLDKREALNRLHGVGKAKGLTHSNLSDLARDTHNVKGLGDPKLKDSDLTQLINHVSSLPDNELKVTPKSAVGLDKDPLRGIPKK